MSGQTIFTVNDLPRSNLEVGNIAFKAGHRWDSENVYGFLTSNTVRRVPKWRTKHVSRYVRAKRKIEKLLAEGYDEELVNAWKFKVRFYGGTKMFRVAPTTTLHDLRVRIVKLLYLPVDLVDCIKLKTEDDLVLTPNPDDITTTIFEADLKPNSLLVLHEVNSILDPKHTAVLACIDEILTQFELGDDDIEKKLSFIYCMTKDILENPEDKRYRSLNSKKMGKILERRERRLLVHSGFQLKEDRFMMEHNDENMSILELIFETLQIYFVPGAGDVLKDQIRRFAGRKKKLHEDEQRQKELIKMKKDQEKQRELRNSTEMFFPMNSSKVRKPSRKETDPDTNAATEPQIYLTMVLIVVFVAIAVYYFVR